MRTRVRGRYRQSGRKFRGPGVGTAGPNLRLRVASNTFNFIVFNHRVAYVDEEPRAEMYGAYKHRQHPDAISGNQWSPSLPWTYPVRGITSRRAGATDGDPRQTQKGCAGDSAPLAGSTKWATSVTKLCDRSHCHDGFVLENLSGTLRSDIALR